MREHEYKARDKTVNKMSRDGLVEENLQKKDSVRVSQRELDNLTLPGQAVDSMNFQRGQADSDRRGQRDHISSDTENPTKAGRRQRQTVKKRRLYEAQARNPMSEPAGDPLSGLSVQPLSENHTHFMQEPDSDVDAESEIPEPESGRGLSEHSSRMESIRGHPSSGRSYAEAVAETNHSRKKKLVQSHFRKGDGQQAGGEDGNRDSVKKNDRYRETPGDAGETLDSVRENIKKKQKREQIHKEQKKQFSRLSFGDDESGMVHGAGVGISKKAASAASHSVSAYAHGKVHEAEQDNSAAEGAHRAEVMAEHSLRNAMRTSRRMVQRKLSQWRESPEGEGIKSRLQFEASQETAESLGKQFAETEQAGKTIQKKFWQKQRIKKSYQAARRGEKTTAEAAKATQSVSGKIKSKAASVLKNNKGIFGAVAVIGLLFLMLSAGLSSCSAMTQGASSSIIGSTYPSTDDDIYDTENAYAALEAALNRQINNMESTHPGYDEYWYQVDEISHNPYHLISYFTAKYGEFTYEQVKDEVEEIFREQYSLYVDEVNDTVTETKTVRVGESLGQVVTSGYCNCSICCGAWAGGATASGAYPTALKSVRMDEAAFIKSMRSASEVRDKSEVKKLKADLMKKEKRFADLDLLIKKVYEDNAMGKLSDRRYEMLSSDYEKEQQELEISMQEIREKLMQFEDDTDRTEEFLSLVHKYTDIQELTPAIVNEFVDKVLVHKIEETDGDRVQEIEIFLNYIGRVELPAQELSREEMAEEEKKRKSRQYRREYMKAYREKHRTEIRRVIEGANAADKQRQIMEAEQSANELLHTDGTEQVAAMVAGENKIIIESSLPTKEEVKAKYGR